MRNENETLIQQRIVQEIRKKYCKPEHEPRLVCMSVPNGIGLNVPLSIKKIVDKSIAVAIEVMKQIGLTVGASDLQIHGKFGRCAHCEIKTSTGSQSDDQLKFQKRIESLEGKYYLLRSVEDVKLIDFDWLLGK
jgi:hypothetical protein